MATTKKTRLVRRFAYLGMALVLGVALYMALGGRALYLEFLANQGRSSIPSLIDALNDRSEVTRKVTVNYLAGFGLDSLGPLREALGDADPARREGAAIALERMTLRNKELLETIRNEVAPQLAKAMEDPEDIVAAHAAVALWRVERDSPLVVPTLIRLCASSDKQARYRALQALEEIGYNAREAVPVLLGISKSDHDPLVRQWAESALKAIQLKQH